MSNQIFYALVVVVIFCIIYTVRAVAIEYQKNDRKGELKRLLNKISGKNTCSDPEFVIKRSVHLIKFYGFSLAEVGRQAKIFTVAEIKLCAYKAFRRYCWKMRQMYKGLYSEYRSLMDIPSETRSKDDVKRYTELRSEISRLGGEINTLYQRLKVIRAQL